MTEMVQQEIARRLSVLMTDRVRPELLTCWDVVSAGRYPYTGRLGLLASEDREKVWKALLLVHGEALAGQDFSCISDGQRQRILLARALCQEPEVLVLDEPTSFLDIRYKLELLSILKSLARKERLAILRLSTSWSWPSGIPVYRRLQRQGIPFTAGVIHENDADYPVAKLLAAEVVAERGFVPIGKNALRRARKRIAACDRVFCPLDLFGPMNEGNRLLRDFAAQARKLTPKK